MSLELREAMQGLQQQLHQMQQDQSTAELARRDQMHNHLQSQVESMRGQPDKPDDMKATLAAVLQHLTAPKRAVKTANGWEITHAAPEAKQ